MNERMNELTNLIEAKITPSVTDMATDGTTSSVYMCFPCYQEFDTLEEVLAHQLTCNTDTVGNEALTTAANPAHLQQAQQQAFSQAFTQSASPQTMPSASSVWSSPGEPGTTTTTSQKKSSDQPKILYQCGDCDALFDSLVLWQHHRKQGQCLQPAQQQEGPEKEVGSEPAQANGRAEVTGGDLDPEEPNSQDHQEGCEGSGRARGRGRGGSQENLVKMEKQEDEMSTQDHPPDRAENPPDTQEPTPDRAENPQATPEPTPDRAENPPFTQEPTPDRAENPPATQDLTPAEEVPVTESLEESTKSKGSESQPQAAQSSSEILSTADPEPSPFQDPPTHNTEEDQLSYSQRKKAAKKLKLPPSLLCVDCGNSFGMVSELVAHRKTQHGLKEALHRCTVCGESFLNTTLFLYHRKQHKEKGKEEVPQIQTRGIPAQDSEDQADQTGHEDVGEEMLEESIVEMVGVGNCLDVGTEELDHNETQSASTSVSEQTTKAAQGKKFLCAQCGASFSQETELSAHRKEKHGLNEKLHHCSQCGQSFMNTTQFLYHRRQHREETVGTGAVTTPPTSPQASKRTLTPAVASSAASAVPSKRPAIRILSMTDLNERSKDVSQVFLKEELLEGPITEGQTDPNPSPPAKLMQDWSRTPLPHVCPHCGQTFTRRVFLRAHVFSHTGEKLFTCKVCQKSFASSPNLLRHSLTHMGTKPFPCSVCGKRFSQHATLKRHALIHNQPKARGRRPRLQMRTAEGEDGEDQLFYCPNCTARFQTDQQLQEHRLLHTSHPFPCSVCGEAFKRRKELDLHSLAHQDKEPVSCIHCSSQFLNQSVLDIHLQRCPRPEDDKTLGRGRGQGRGRSMGQVECDMCGHCCMTQDGLDLHRLSHTGQTPLRCPMSPCRRRFASSSALGEHILAHCQGTLGKGRGSKRFHCQICGKDFSYTSTFNVHMRIHTDERPFECSTCGKRFRQLPHLQDHERIHSGLRPFCCWVCGKSFSVAARLTEHARIHSGEKPYTCPRCPSAFRSRSNLDKHIRLHADEPKSDGTTAADAEGARILSSLVAGAGGEGESAVQAILLVQGDGAAEGVMVPTVPGSEHSSGAVFSGQAGTSQLVFLGGQAISVPSLSAIMEGREIPSVTVVDGQEVSHTIEFILEETIS
ncbi:hypothetical protein DPEC_G00144380 [Dallia pectoralis]|uniref:Uncharacterized protein n=1 Tax=Dallia pectoralis TaxID=75939 RepID=A0ACC2GNI5_DALPE|nr:hypothetical protein DPEC_G00144380 [Dallia pectoralis]